jgi:Ca2+-binding EF-hand superfamily protein
LYDLQGRGELTIDELRYINDQFKYGYSDEQLWEIIHAVGGFNAETITFERFNKFISKKLASRKLAF